MYEAFVLSLIFFQLIIMSCAEVYCPSVIVCHKAAITISPKCFVIVVFVQMLAHPYSLETKESLNNDTQKLSLTYGDLYLTTMLTSFQFQLGVHFPKVLLPNYGHKFPSLSA